jgi:hypothetical protein
MEMAVLACGDPAANDYDGDGPEALGKRLLSSDAQPDGGHLTEGKRGFGGKELYL